MSQPRTGAAPAQGPVEGTTADAGPRVWLVFAALAPAALAPAALVAAALVPADDVLAVCDGLTLVDVGWLGDADVLLGVVVGVDELLVV